MDLKNFELLARYNVWSTHKLNQVLKNVSNDDFNGECGLYFKSISGTLNHVLVGEHYLWFPRFLAKPSPILRLNTIIESDKIVVIKNGQIQEMGTHKQLLKNKGYYYELYSSQFDINEEN